MGKHKLSSMLGPLDYEEANALIAKYNSKVPFVKQLSDRCMRKANETGVIRTKKGRKCRFNMWEPKDFGVYTPEKFENAVAKYGRNNIKRCYTYKALNRLIQGFCSRSNKSSCCSL